MSDDSRTLAVLGTLVWDRIVPLDPTTPAVEDWGGIAYALVAAEGALPSGWRMRPLIRVGADLEESAREFLSQFSVIDEGGLVVVPEANNRVELRYHSSANRTEKLSGGVSGWTLPEILEVLDGCDALLVNFISGFEMSLDVAMGVRAAFPGPMYADMHSLFLGVGADGTRTPRTLPDWPWWARCFDVVQMNENEFSRCGPDTLQSLGGGGAPPRLIAVTLGERGVDLYGELLTEGSIPQRLRADQAASATGRGHASNVTLDGLPLGSDPTGCGDVWGGVMFSRLLAGDAAVTAASTANQVAATSAGVSGVTALRARLNRPND